ncbi:insulin-like receptor isoform X2 [Prorops nasuta]|uniref:insulin-like receptor isoform X2 n=1 Tax=Prorops nasuta TaxID=863751 RepID=UPI0034CD1CC3
MVLTLENEAAIRRAERDRRSRPTCSKMRLPAENRTAEGHRVEEHSSGCQGHGRISPDWRSNERLQQPLAEEPKDPSLQGREFQGQGVIRAGKPCRTIECENADISGTRCASSVVRWPLSSRRRKHGTLALGPLRKVAILVFLLAIAASALAESPNNYTLGPSTGKVCQSIDIRNSVNQFSRLKGCRVVEGFVQILLIDRADDSAYANLTFPELVEITGYLVLYRVNGLRSVGHLFPNLTVIRGHSLFINYALVAFEMMHLQEIGLTSLTDIQRGSVRFEKNPALCYVDTIEWDVIAKAGKGEHVISGNKPKNGCPVCSKSCPTRPTKLDENLCWNRQDCQQMCERKCEEKACNVDGECCHPSCLGSCIGPRDDQCKICKEVMLESNQCVQSCPPGMYVFMNRRCVKEDECRNMKRPREALSTVKNYPYKPFNGSCVMECPAGFMEEERSGKSSCVKCDGPCLKECPGASVDSIASAQRLRGCTHIRGSLEIQIRGGKNIVKELEDSLNMIVEIDGYLKIVRCFPLISLNFLKSLKVIHGKSLDNGKYTLAVFDNQNLQELWDWETHPTIKILSKDGPAKIFFHFNPKLCLHKIEKLRDKAGLGKFTELEVASNSNGDKVACNVTELQSRVTKYMPEAVLIEWEAFTHHDPRSLLGYVVYFIEAPNENVTMYDGRDACGGDGWRVDDVSATESTDNSNADTNDKFNSSVPKEPVYLIHILTQLKPYTQYAFYVKTYTIATERSGAQSKVRYFTTLPDAPSAPRALSTWSNASSELVMTWHPPLRKNGNLTHYRIVGRWEPDDPSFLAQRNYCDEPMLLPEKKPISVMAEEERKRAEAENEMAKVPKTSCDCVDREPDQSMREKEVSSSIAFEDALHNQVYIKRMNSRRRRDVSEMLEEPHEKYMNHTQEDQQGSDKIINGTYTEFERLIPSTNLTFVMKSLRHFAVYNIEVQACREQVENDTKNNCSTKSMRTYRTLPLENADDIPVNSLKLSVIGGNNSLATVKLRWNEPPQPNGLIVTYQIEYKRVDIQNIKATVVCIIRRDFVNAGYSYLLKDLPAGNYSVKVRATSLAGNGAYTEVKYFFLEEYSTTDTLWFLYCTILFIALALLSLGTFYVIKRKFGMRRVPSSRLIATCNPEYVSTTYVADEWEVCRTQIQLIKELGNGSFGMVYEGLAKNVIKGKPEVRCAVKTVNEEASERQRMEFLNEASVMKAFKTHHVVKLLGVVSKGHPTLVVMELMVNGDLKSYLRSQRPDTTKTPPTLRRILQMAIEIADGMSYLSAKKFVHRDLAARNCMVAEDLTVKIGDFGMTRDIYETEYYRKGTKGLLPVRWMAPESLKDGVFTSFSDVWSFGVVLWEMVTLGSQPYLGLSNDQVLRYVIDGGVMERPENCPDLLYNLMRRTWNRKTTRRPTFIDIATILLQEVKLDNFEKVSFYHSPEGIEARNQNLSHSPLSDSYRGLEMITLQEFRDAEGGIEECSPLKPDFSDFASFEPSSLKKRLSPRYPIGSYQEHPRTLPFRVMSSSKIALKAGFDDFEGVSGDSVTSSKDTLNLPYAEDSLKSTKTSPFIQNKGGSKSDISQTSDFPSMDATEDSDDKKESKPLADYVNKSETLNNGYISNTT